MGHDISGFKTEEFGDEIAYLRRSAFSDFKNVIYEALECPHYSSGLSGIGDYAKFSEEELKKALDYVGDNPNYEPEWNFIKDCLDNLDENGEMTIYFG